MPTYNRSDFLETSIGSVLNQSFDNWELIVIDDGSTDTTAAVIQSFEDERIKYFYQENQGVSAARNAGIDKANGTYICFLDSDDEYLDNHLQLLHQCILYNDYPIGFLYTLGYLSYNGKLKKDKERVELEDLSIIVCPYTDAISIHHSILNQQKFEEDLVIWEDADLWERIFSNYPTFRIPFETVIYNKHENNSVKRTMNYYLEGERSLFYYMKDRKKITMEVFSYLSFMYNKMFLLCYSKKDVSGCLYYYFKHILFYPLNIFSRTFAGMSKRLLSLIIFGQ